MQVGDIRSIRKLELVTIFTSGELYPEGIGHTTGPLPI